MPPLTRKNPSSSVDNKFAPPQDLTEHQRAAFSPHDTIIDHGIVPSAPTPLPNDNRFHIWTIVTAGVAAVWGYSNGVTKQLWPPSTGEADQAGASADLPCTTALQDITGATITVTNAGTYLIAGYFEVNSTGAGWGAFHGALLVNGVDEGNYAICSEGETTQTPSMVWVKTLAAGDVIKLRALKTINAGTVTTRHNGSTKIACITIAGAGGGGGGGGVTDHALLTDLDFAASAHTGPLTVAQHGVIAAIGGGGAHPHSDTGSLTSDDHTQYPLSVGRAGGQEIDGGTAAGEKLTLRGTTHATKGPVSIPDWVELVDHAASTEVTAVATSAMLYSRAGLARQKFILGTLQAELTPGSVFGMHLTDGQFGHACPSDASATDMEHVGTIAGHTSTGGTRTRTADADGLYINYSVTTTTHAEEVGAADIWSRNGRPCLTVKVRIPTGTSVRFFAGFTDVAVASFINTDTPSTAGHWAGITYQSTTPTNWRRFACGGTAISTTDLSGAAFTAGNIFYLRVMNYNGFWVVQVFDSAFALLGSSTATTNSPAATIMMHPLIAVYGDGATRTMDLWQYWMTAKANV